MPTNSKVSQDSSKRSIGDRRFIKKGTGVTVIGGIAPGSCGLTEIIVGKRPHK